MYSKVETLDFTIRIGSTKYKKTLTAGLGLIYENFKLFRSQVLLMVDLKAVVIFAVL